MRSHADATASGATAPGIERQIRVGHTNRRYLLHVPAGVARSGTAPLVLVLHGSSGSPADARHASQMDRVADSAGLVVAYPAGSKGRFGLHASDWNAGGCCGVAGRARVDDVAFLLGVIDDVAARAPIDRARVYVAGFSDGGRMAYEVACRAADRVAAIAVVAGSVTDTTCRPARPVSVIAFHATADPSVPYDSLGARAFAAVDGCRQRAREALTPHVARTTFSACDDATSVELYSIAGGAHGWPGEPPGGAGSVGAMAEVSATARLVPFLLAHRRATR